MLGYIWNNGNIFRNQILVWHVGQFAVLDMEPICEKKVKCNNVGTGESQGGFEVAQPPPNTLQRLGCPTENHPTLQRLGEGRGSLRGLAPSRFAGGVWGGRSPPTRFNWHGSAIGQYQSALSYRYINTCRSLSIQLSVIYRSVISQHSVIGHLSVSYWYLNRSFTSQHPVIGHNILMFPLECSYVDRKSPTKDNYYENSYKNL